MLSQRNPYCSDIFMIGVPLYEISGLGNIQEVYLGNQIPYEAMGDERKALHTDRNTGLPLMLDSITHYGT